ncbi:MULTISPECIES: ATP-dependent 6-phosphofructokinase [unclassified Pseudodesulfovibrio]|uniref:ATP-dependent 6-phosphofructokinase n=1 Tax=unclassified Pseudodesulfovibrio TaxID=2661612 RepID=UPI000FEBB02A|nr:MULTISPECIES: ATP-dependent 6-phosphofructokinase [unclassified Pseudodesulfovibrio]MCJ2165514.1 ATP-dependent 6-phosphofructokinase [Pseudodesulfovibrio sp. S3-i]RWU03121.1 ATP-dependent 6-phosphofructokinase [Pseudodesulfovibrio sp. S3]
MKASNGEGGTPKDTTIATVGTAKVMNPIKFGWFVEEDDAVLVNISRKNVEGTSRSKKKPVHVYFEPAGPRDKVYYDPSKTKCAVVTCGGLCPGLNDVIRAIVMTAHHEYKVSSVLGIQYGLAGFAPEQGYDVIELTPDFVSRIHEFGGTVLGSSRGPQDPEVIVDALERMNVSILFMIGGDGTMRAASKVVDEIANRGLSISVVGLPKTIDNDINYASPSFGFDTSVETATLALRGAHVEATGAPWGIGLVKVMGRDAGFIAAQSALSCQEINFCLIPEDPFDIHGENGFLAALDKRMKKSGNAVIVVAEGAGQDMLKESGKKDASGNVKLSDIATLLKEEILNHFKNQGIEATLKYIDPSYIIRSVPANANDRIYCSFLGIHAVHAGMSGRTGLVISRWNGRYVHIPMDLVTKGKKRINTCSNYWRAVLESTGQPISMKNK